MLKTLPFSLLGGTAAALLIGSPAQALTFNWSYSGTGINASGTFDTTPTGNPNEYLIQSITGQRNSVPITALLSVGSFPTNNPPPNDNLLYYPSGGASGQQLALAGFSFSVGSSNYNVYYQSGFSSPYREITGTGNSGTSVANLANFSATPVPTPALLPGLMGMSLALLRKRKAELSQEAEEA